MLNTEDSILVKLLKQGNIQAFNQLYARYSAKLYGFSYQLTHSRKDAEEIVQEVFMKLWEMKEDLDPERNFGSLLFAIGKNKIYNKARSQVYNQKYFEYIKQNAPQGAELTEQEVAFQETKILLNQAINLLPERRRQIFILSRIKGLSNKEIAVQMKTSISNVENQIGKALKFIRQSMAKNEILIYVFSIHLFF